MRRKLRESIPNLDGLYNTLKEFIIEKQRNQGYIDTQNTDGKNDSIYGIEYCEFMNAGVEQYVYGVRVKNNDIQIILEPIMNGYKTLYTDEDFKTEDNWVSLKDSDVYYIPTLFNIVESLEEYTC